MPKIKEPYNFYSNTRANSKRELNLTKLSFYLTLGWTLLLIAVLAWNCLQIKEGVHNEGIIALRMSVDNDHSFRTWATEHGGVYVPITPTNPPNPYLSHVENYILPIPNENEFTLLNPAYIMRQVYQVRMDTYGVYNRLTSLDAINPVNTADYWETETLRKLKENTQIDEIAEITSFNGEPAIRLMQPFIIEEGCLKCHGHQGFQVGDVSGGISASMPLAPYTALIRSQQLALLPGYSLIWLVGLLGIIWFISRLQISTATLRKNEARNRAMLEAIPDMLFRYNSAGTILDAKIKPESPTSPYFQKHNLVGRNIAHILPTKDAETLCQAINNVISTGEMQLIEYSYPIQEKEYFFEERLVLESEDEVISIVRDVTRQKNFETKLEYLSYHDELTGINNRNYFDSEIIRLNKWGDYPITIILADINGLKLINDALGHANGDKLLIHCAQVLQQSLRSTDILARVGGDEFAAILPLTNASEGQEVIQRIRTNILKHNEKFPALPLSLSIGAATAQNSTQELMDVYKGADEQMYQEKLAEGTSAQCKMAETIMSSIKNKEENPSIDHERLKEICQRLGIDTD